MARLISVVAPGSNAAAGSAEANISSPAATAGPQPVAPGSDAEEGSDDSELEPCRKRG